jgi:hypothetical protein
MERSLYVFGDIKTIPNLGVEPRESFWGLAARDLNVDYIYNFSFANNCLDNIIHLIVNHEFNFTNSYFLIGVPPLTAYSVLDPTKNKPDNQRVFMFDRFFNTHLIESSVLSGVVGINFSEAFSNDLNYTSYFRAEWHQVLMLEKIYLLSEMLKAKGAKYIIANLSKPFDMQEQWPVASPIMTKVSNDLNCVIFNNTYYSVNMEDGIEPIGFALVDWNGHYGSEGNNNWYTKVIKPKMQELRWVQ